LARRAGEAWAPFWADLKAGSDLFERDWQAPRVSVCRGRYTFTAGRPGGDGSEPVAVACAGPA
jgi:murein L,D-transpeptidase YafK